MSEPMNLNTDDLQEQVEAIEARVEAARPGRPEDLVGMTVFLHRVRARRKPYLCRRFKAMDVPLKVTERYEGAIVVTDPAGKEHHLTGDCWTLMTPAEQSIVERAEAGR
jgi:hypothetical protein